MQRTIFFLACFFICASLAAQQYPYVHYTPREGLANNRARSIFQDSRGKLYISTYGGLSVYDGTRFSNYNTINGLSADLINDIVEMGEDSIWILPNANKVHFLVHGRLKDFIPADNFTPLINQLIKSSNGHYYAIADEGLFRLEKNRFIKIQIDGLPPGETAKTFIQAKEIDQKLYILSNPNYELVGANLLVYDLAKNKLIAFDNHIRAGNLFSPSANELWLTSDKLYMVEKLKDENSKLVIKPLPDSYHIPKNLVPNFVYIDRQKN